MSDISIPQSRVYYRIEFSTSERALLVRNNLSSIGAVRVELEALKHRYSGFVLREVQMVQVTVNVSDVRNQV